MNSVLLSTIKKIMIPGIVCDPNFSIIYKKVQDVEYVALDSEPDLMEKFPTLLEKIWSFEG